jgi:hypothetical protein
MEVSPLLFSAITLLLLAFMLWFALGTHRNVRKGNDLMKWLQDGLPVMGSRTTVRWLGSSAVQLRITEPADPFSEAEVVIVLEPRDLSWLWALGRARGRRDMLIMRARLNRSPRFELEAGDVSTWTGADRLNRLDLEAWRSSRWGGDDLRVAHTADADPEAVRPIWTALDEASGGAWRLSVRRDNPHIEVHVRMPDPARARAGPLFRAFGDLAGAVTGKR